jgi:DNA repair photolyase
VFIMNTRIPISAIKGRGAASRIAHRFSSDAREAFDDGWDTLVDGEREAGMRPPVTTEVSFEDARSVFSHNDSPDIPFSQSINPYRGCEHGCIYCYARPTHSYLNLSPGLDFETRLVAKRNIAEVLRRELARPRYRPQDTVLGTITDAYQPIERELGLTRSVLALMHETRHPVGLITKSSGVERDIDLLADMAQARRVGVYITITTLDAELARKLEPRAAAPWRRLRTIRTLAEAGIPVGVSVSPQIPFINEDLEQVLAAAWEAGARSAFYTVLRLPWEINALFQEWLRLHFPDRAERVMARVRDMRGGRDYDADFATRMKGSGLWADLIRQRFRQACRRHGFNLDRHALDASGFRSPSPSGQRALFE